MKVKSILFLFIIVIIASILRLYNVSANPPGLYMDEASIGLNAYSILTKGVDEFNKSFPLFFESFGDYKMPIYIYAVSISMALFGKTEFAIRAPSVFAGIATVLVTYFFVRGFAVNIKQKLVYEKLALISSAVIAISSYHIHFSRGGFEVNLAVFLFMSGILALQRFYLHDKKVIHALMGIILLLLSTYSYHSFRVITPLTLAFFFFLLWRANYRPKVSVILLFITGLFLLPLFLFSLSPEGSARFAQTSSLSEYHELPVLKKIMTYPMVLLKNYLSFFSLSFLFNDGDGIGRHQIANFGLVFRTQLPFLALGLIYLLKKREQFFSQVILYLLLIAPVPAMLAVPSPHTLRPLLMAIPLSIIIGQGYLSFFQNRTRLKRVLLMSILFLGVFEYTNYLHHYYVHYPQVNGLDWGAGYKEVVYATERSKEKYDVIVVENSLSYAKVYFDFYSPSVQPLYVDSSWKKPSDWGNKSVLYVRPYYGQSAPDNLIENVTLPYAKNEIFAQFIKL